MVLTAAQTTTFFEHAKEMGIPHATVMQLQSKGITLVADLVDFDKDSLQELVDNMRHPGGCVPDPNPGAPPRSTIPTPPFVFGAKSQKHIAIACDLVKYYTTVGHDLTVANLQWITIMKNFEIQWTVLKERKGMIPLTFPRYQRHCLLSNGWKLFRTSLIGRLEIATSHWHTSFMRNPTPQLLLHPLLLVDLTPSSMDLLKLSS